MAARGVQVALEGEYRDVKDKNVNPTILATKTDFDFWSGLVVPDLVTK